MPIAAIAPAELTLQAMLTAYSTMSLAALDEMNRSAPAEARADGYMQDRASQWVAEAVATFGLLLVILRAPGSRVAAIVAAYIGAAYWFTASTSFANPAAAFGRMFSDSFAGIAPASAPGFVLAELVGAGLAVWVHALLAPGRTAALHTETTATSPQNP